MTIIDQKMLVLQLKMILEPYNSGSKYTPKHKTNPDLTGLLASLEIAIVESVLLHTHGNQQRASRILGMNRGTVRTHWKKARQISAFHIPVNPCGVLKTLTKTQRPKSQSNLSNPSNNQQIG